GARLGAFRVTEQDYPNLWINRAGWTNDVGIHFAGVKDDRAVFHMVTAIERKTGLFCDARFQFDRSGGVVGCGNNASQFLCQDRRIVLSFLLVPYILS